MGFYCITTTGSRIDGDAKIAAYLLKNNLVQFSTKTGTYGENQIVCSIANSANIRYSDENPFTGETSDDTADSRLRIILGQEVKEYYRLLPRSKRIKISPEYVDALK